MLPDNSMTHLIFLFLILFLIVAIWNPSFLIKMYNNVFGKVVLILLILFFTYYTIYFGLALLIIILLVIQWEPLNKKQKGGKKKSKKGKSVTFSKTVEVKESETIYNPYLNINPVIDEFKPVNSKQMTVPKSTSKSIEPYVVSSTLQNAKSLII